MTSPASRAGADVLVVTFVCTANICRSAYAEVVARHLLADHPTRLAVRSAGTWGFDRERMCAEMAREAELRGADPTPFRSRRVTRDTIAESDLVLAAGGDHLAFLVDEWPAAFRKVFTFGQYAAAVADADPSLTGRELVRHAAQHRRPARPADDITDPYRRGGAAAAACAEQLDSLLAAILPPLTA